MDDGPIALGAYEAMADAFDERAESKAHNADYDRPAVMSMLPGLDGLRVLDAGCGPGIYAEILARAGARVVGFDVSPRMVGHATRRLGGRARVVVGDLERPFDFLDGEAPFDGIVCALALDYIRDWGHAFREFHRVLRGGGWLVFSAEHPADVFHEHHPGGNYFEVEPVSMEWRGFGTAVTVPSYRRPLAAMIGPMLDAGFALDRLLEPRPTPAFEAKDPADYAKMMRRPGFLCVRATRRIEGGRGD